MEPVGKAFGALEVSSLGSLRLLAFRGLLGG